MPPGALFTCSSKLPQFLLSRAAVLNCMTNCAGGNTGAFFAKKRPRNHLCPGSRGLFMRTSISRDGYLRSITSGLLK